VKIVARRRKRYAPKRAKRTSTFMDKIPAEVKDLAAGFLYTAVIKEPTEKITKNISDSLALNVSDNLVRVGGIVAIRRMVGNSIPFARKVADIALGIEGAEAGKAGFNSLFNGGQTTAQTQTVNTESDVFR